MVEALVPDLLGVGPDLLGAGLGSLCEAVAEAAVVPAIEIAVTAEIAVPRAPERAALGSGPVAVAPPVVRSEHAVLVFDVETTGTDRKKDQVIELCMQRGLSGTDYKVWRFKPTAPMSPGAQAVHGISPEDLAGCPDFASCIDEISAWFAAAEVIVGYNLAFDIDMLQSEYERAGRPPLDVSTKAVVDPFRLWQQCEPRSLQHAHQRFVGQGFESAHSAAADVAATGRVLAGMLAAFGLDHHDWDGVATVCDPKRLLWVGPSRHLQWEGPVVVMSFGKHAGVPLHVLASGEHAGYLRWVCDRDFPAHVAEVCRRALELAGDVDDFHGWIRQRFGAPATGAAAANGEPVSAATPASVTSVSAGRSLPDLAAPVTAAPAPPMDAIVGRASGRRPRGAPRSA